MPSGIEITGVAELERKIGRMRTVKVLFAPMTRSLARLNRDVAVYPNRPASNRKSTYVRKFLFMRSWKIDIDTQGETLVGTLGNPTPYGPYVMGPGPDKPMQAWMHVGIWRTTEDVVEKHESDIVADFNRTIQAELAK